MWSQFGKKDESEQKVLSATRLEKLVCIILNLVLESLSILISLLQVGMVL